MLSDQEVVEKIKDIEWDNRVKRPGFLQPKGIVSEGEGLPINLTPNVTVRYKNIGWIQDYNLYHEKTNQDITIDVKKAFIEDSDWPLGVIKFFDGVKPKVDDFIIKLQQGGWNKEEKIKIFLEYVHLLKNIQKYYAIAVPLTNYCEEQLKNTPELIEYYAVVYQKLDIDKIGESKDPATDYAWLKTGYNVIQTVIAEELQSEDLHKDQEKKPEIPKELKSYVVGMQVGIYTRNRMKELSQKLWYYVENLALSMANDLGISREEFFSLTYHEVVTAYEGGSIPDTRARQKGFCIFFLDDQEYILTGKKSKELVDFFSQIPETDEIKGVVACKGRVEGVVKVIFGTKEFSKLNENDIIVTPMTTPEFIVLLKKAAAIVTDEGGLSCHAAIISRELNIPCVMGTKVATQVFKDGDMVEVDAQKGVVRKI